MLYSYIEKNLLPEFLYVLRIEAFDKMIELLPLKVCLFTAHAIEINAIRYSLVLISFEAILVFLVNRYTFR